MCLLILQPVRQSVFVDSFHGRGSSLLFSQVVNHTREYFNILEYTENFRAYTDLGNQGVTNVGK